MFIGHYALGFGAKRLAPGVSLGVLFLACQLADILWPNLVLLGVENFTIEPGATVMTPLDFASYPYSHSLVALLLWAFVFSALYMALSRSGPKTAIIVVALVLSHWVLDALTHRPDIPITLGQSPRVGAGLWNYPKVAIPLEVSLYALGVYVYQRATRPLNRAGSMGFWVLVFFLPFVYVLNVFGPPPPSTAAVTWSAQAMWLIIAWGFWVDRNREAVPNYQPAPSG